MEALSTVPCEVKVLACPEDCAAVFAPLADEAGFCLVPGSKEDVLARYCFAIKRFNPDRVIRATGDNPFVFADAAEFLNTEATALGADYAGYSGLPYGAGVESVNAEALLKAEHEASTPLEREHVCPYLYNHPDIFRLHRPLAPLRWQGLEMRVTVDMAEDFKRAEQLYQALSVHPLTERNRGETIIAAYRSIGL
jgi:spore coat polysaccharide biosynthesis protein SpsF